MLRGFEYFFIKVEFLKTVDLYASLKHETFHLNSLKWRKKNEKRNITMHLKKLRLSKREREREVTISIEVIEEVVRRSSRLRGVIGQKLRIGWWWRPPHLHWRQWKWKPVTRRSHSLYICIHTPYLPPAFAFSLYSKSGQTNTR